MKKIWLFWDFLMVFSSISNLKGLCATVKRIPNMCIKNSSFLFPVWQFHTNLICVFFLPAGVKPFQPRHHPGHRPRGRTPFTRKHVASAGCMHTTKENCMISTRRILSHLPCHSRASHFLLGSCAPLRCAHSSAYSFTLSRAHGNEEYMPINSMRRLHTVSAQVATE